LIHVQPGKRAQNAYIERFNGTFRQGILDAFLLHDLQEVHLITEHWLEEYNTIRPDDHLQGLSHATFRVDIPDVVRS
jgi:putative transposase